MKNKYPIIQVLSVIAMLAMFLLTQAAIADTEITNEFWISTTTSTNTADLGTLNNPFDGSTEVKFDTVMSLMPPYSIVHILAGTYQTEGQVAWLVQPGEKIIGSGMNLTILQLTNGYVVQSYIIRSASSDETNVEISDLTCDCDPEGIAGNYGGVTINGNNVKIRRVKVIHCSSSTEMWGISAGGHNNLIEGCEVSDFLTSGCDGVMIAGGPDGDASGAIIDNLIIGNPEVEEIGINGGYLSHYLVQGNVVEGIQAGVYNDTGGCTNVIIADNVFKNVRHGILYVDNEAVRQNIDIHDNVIMLVTNAFPGGQAEEAFNMGDNTTNINIVGNIVGWAQAPTSAEIGSDYFLAMAEPGDQGILIADNRVDSRLYNANDGTNGISVIDPENGYQAYDNYDLNGNLLPNLSQRNFGTQWLPTTKPDGTAVSYFGMLPGWAGNVGGTWYGNAAKSAIMGGPATNIVFSINVLTTNAGTFTFHIQLGGADNLNQFASPTFATNFVSSPGTNVGTLFYTYGWANATNPWTTLTGYAWMNNNMNNTNVVLTGGNFTAFSEF